MGISTTRVFALPDSVDLSTSPNVPCFRRLERDNEGNLWAQGDQNVYVSRDGTVWRDLSLNLRSEGSFTAYSVLNIANQLYLFARNSNGRFAYMLTSDEREWRARSEIETESSLVACSIADTLLLLASGKSGTFLYRSTDGALSWSKQPLRGDGVPVYIHVSSSGTGFCCLWHSLIGKELRQGDLSSLYATADFGRTWKRVASVSTMVLCASSTEDDGILLGGTQGQLLSFDADHRLATLHSNQHDVVAVDSWEGNVLAITESDDSPAQHSLILGKDGKNWLVRILGADQAIISTSKSFYLCRSF